MPIRDINKVSACSLNYDIALQKFQKIAIFIDNNNSNHFGKDRLIVYAFDDLS